MKTKSVGKLVIGLVAFCSLTEAAFGANSPTPAEAYGAEVTSELRAALMTCSYFAKSQVPATPTRDHTAALGQALGTIGQSIYNAYAEERAMDYCMVAHGYFRK